MAKQSSVTVTQIRLEQDHAEGQVLAMGAVLGERAVAITRLAMMAMIGLATRAIPTASGAPLEQDPVRHVLIAFYLAAAISSLVVVFRIKKAQPRAATWVPVCYIFIDSGFVVANAWIDHRLHWIPRPEITTVCFALLLCFSVARFRVFHVVLSTATSVAGLVWVAWFQGWVDPVWTSFTCACLLSLGLLITFTNRRISGMFSEIRRRENLSRFLPRQVVDRVLSSGGATLHPVQREVTILFSDIRNFTSMSETLPPKEVLEFLDEYFGHMAQIVKGHDGMLNKFLGDGMLAVWGVPDLMDNHAERALKAAVDMRRKMIEINAGREQAGRTTFRIGIGVHTGVVAAGMLGGSDQREYTVIGDAVNLASRIEGLTKTLGTDILASETTWKQGGSRFTGERVGEEHVKGRDAGVVVYALREPSLKAVG